MCMWRGFERPLVSNKKGLPFRNWTARGVPLRCSFRLMRSLYMRQSDPTGVTQFLSCSYCGKHGLNLSWQTDQMHVSSDVCCTTATVIRVAFGELWTRWSKFLGFPCLTDFPVGSAHIVLLTLWNHICGSAPLLWMVNTSALWVYSTPQRGS